VKRRKVRFTTTARKHVRLLRQWWQENSARPEILHDDLDEAVRMVAIVPGIGKVYPIASIPGMRRLYLERLVSHLYYTFDADEVVVRALWHARRGSGPEFT
jgi:plasmid stabilization system protein ParE